MKCSGIWRSSCFRRLKDSGLTKGVDDDTPKYLSAALKYLLGCT